MQSVKLGDNIPFIYIQVHGKSIDQILPDAWRNAKSMEDKVSTNGTTVDGCESSGTGTIFFMEDERRNTSIDGLIESLRGAGYYPVFVGCRESYSVETGERHKVIRYVFRRTPQSDPHDRNWCERLITELKRVASTSMWNIVAHFNPFYENGKVTEGKNLVSIDLNSREALVKNDGTPVTRWVKDSYKNRVGDAPFQLKPATYLGVRDNQLVKLIDPDEINAANARAMLLAEREAALASGR